MYSSAQLIPPVDIYNSEFDPRLPHATRINSREAYPGVIKPLDLTVVAMPNDHAMRCQLRDLGVTTFDPPALLSNRVHQGRVYANLSWLMWMADMLPGARASDVAQQLFGSHSASRITRPEVTKAELSVAKRHTLRFYAAMITTTLKAKKRLEKHLALRNGIDLENKTNSELDALIIPWQDELIRACERHTRGTLAELMMISALSPQGANSAKYPEAIPSDLGEVESTAPARKIREIAQVTKRRNPTLARALKRSYQRWETLHEIDANAHDALRAVVDRYGYRSVAECLISAPSWAEDPTPVMDAFVGFLLANSRDRPPPPPTPSAAARSDIMQTVGPIRRAYLGILIKFARSAARARERAKAGMIIRVDMLRQLFREIGRRLLNGDRIDEVSDLYFLTLAEVRGALTGDSDTDLRRQAALRRREVERLEALGEADELICGHEPVVSAAPEQCEGVALLRGLGVSGSAIEGLARVVTHSDKWDLFEPGEILVSTHTDEGWTPYFTLAAAVVVEAGGMLTHTAVVARELGLPAVVNVQGATRIIRSGDRLRLDPESGEVHILVRARSENAAVH